LSTSDDKKTRNWRKENRGFPTSTISSNFKILKVGWKRRFHIDLCDGTSLGGEYRKGKVFFCSESITQKIQGRRETGEGCNIVLRKWNTILMNLLVHDNRGSAHPEVTRKKLKGLKRKSRIAMKIGEQFYQEGEIRVIWDMLTGATEFSNLTKKVSSNQSEASRPYRAPSEKELRSSSRACQLRIGKMRASLKRRGSERVREFSVKRLREWQRTRVPRGCEERL